MATESPIRIPRGTDRWTTLKPLNRFRPSSAEMAIEGLGLFLKEQKLNSHENAVVPTRSESAPPSMEGSMAAIENMFSQKVSILSHDDPSSSFRDNSDANLDKKFKRPLHGGDLKMNRTKYADGSRMSLPAHKEESEDDQLSEQSVSVSAEKAALLGYRSNSLDSSQVMSLDGSKDSVLEHTVHEDLNTAATSIKDYATVDATVRVNALSVSHSSTHLYQQKETLNPFNNMLQTHIVPQESSSYRIEGSYSRDNYSGTTLPYGTSTHPFHYGPSSASGQEVQPMLQSPGFKPPLFTTTAAYMNPSGQYYPSMQQTGYFHPQYNTPYNFNSAVFPSYMGGYSQQGGVPMAFNDASSIHAYDPQNLMKYYGQFGMQMQPHFAMQYLQPSSLHSMYGRFDHHQTPRDGSYMTQMSPRESRKEGELVGLGIEHNPQNLPGMGYNSLNLLRGSTPGHYPFVGSGLADPSMQFHAPSIVSPLKQAKPETGTNYSGARYYGGLTHSSSASPSRSSEFHSSSWSDMNSYSLLEELKSGKGQRYKLADVAGHICEFSIDQHGSRFIQQQLETCSDEEKAYVFDEVVPHASKLMVDVFGNYVIQKLFEYGSPKQRENLANLLQGQILPLSLQMYGCRVIQKALDVIELEQKAKLVRELDGHVIRCVRDQNGNHVIQKCIESIPSEKIDFIISSFRGQVATLSMHPYGCRVIQRVLEHCDDGSYTQFIIDEILESVCSLAQDQYGNYVTQHVLERGKPRERNEIIEKLTGSVVQLSQHKFASNVVEKCLEYSDSAARDLLIKEIIGHGEKNDNLLTMMKDQYANYVIQKILQKCSDDQREVLLGLVRNHLTSLKKYTYGKHIVARFEMLCGEETQETGL